MAPPHRRESTTLRGRLFEETYRFEFFQAVRLLEQLDRDRSDPVGTSDSIDHERIRFRSELALEFPTSDVGRLEGDTVRTLPVAFFGVATPHSYGSLPNWYAKLAREGDGVLSDFFDVFNHRLISLFYRAWERSHVGVAYERTGGSSFERALFSLIGLGTARLRRRLPIDDLAILRRAGAALHRTGNALAFLVSDYFEVPARVHEFVPRWYDLGPDEQMRLGVSGSLGQTSILGSRCRLAQGCFRVRLGPLDSSQFMSFLPDGDGYRPLVELIRLVAGPQFDFDIQLVVSRDAVPRLRISRDPDPELRLGWSTWCGDGPDHDPDDPVFSTAAPTPVQ